MACIDNLVVSGICDDTVSETGFTLMQAPGMNVQNFADIATDSSGVEMVEEKKQLAILQIKNDFTGWLGANNIIAQIANPVYQSSNFKPTVSMGTGGERGLVLRKKNTRGGLNKTKISRIEVYPLAAGDGVIQIIDNGIITAWDVTFVANQVNIFTSEQLDGLPYMVNSSTAQILIDQTTIPFASAEVICRTGCNGTTPNECAYLNGWDGTKEVKSEGYGINIYFNCQCDYEQIICDSKEMFGELIWLKWQINIFEEQQSSNRFDNWVIYRRDEVTAHLSTLYGKYNARWEAVMNGMLGILQKYRDACLDCRKIRFVTNV